MPQFGVVAFSAAVLAVIAGVVGIVSAGTQAHRQALDAMAGKGIQTLSSGAGRDLPRPKRWMAFVGIGLGILVALGILLFWLFGPESYWQVFYD